MWNKSNVEYEEDDMSKKCIECGVELEDDARYCDECGAEQNMEKENVPTADGEESREVRVPQYTYKITFAERIIDLLSGIWGFFKFVIGIIVLYLIIGLVSGNLKEWNEKVIYYAKVVMHYANNLDISKSYDEGTPEFVIDQYIQALFDNDEYTALKQIDTTNEELKTMTEALVEIFQQLEMTQEFEYLRKDMEYAEYTIESGNNNQFIVTIRTCDYQSIIAGNLDNYGYDVIEKAVKSAPKTTKKEAVVNMRENNGEWYIESFEDTRVFLDALTGNLLGSYYSIEE